MIIESSFGFSSNLQRNHNHDKNPKKSTYLKNHKNGKNHKNPKNHKNGKNHKNPKNHKNHHLLPLCLSSWTASLFIPHWRHLRYRQYWHLDDDVDDHNGQADDDDDNAGDNETLG